MFLPSRARLVSLVLIAGSVPFLLALSLQGRPAPPPSPFVPGTPRQVADALDKIVQPRFQDVTAGQFGLTRLVPAVRGHQSVGFLGYFRTNTPAEAALLASADAPHRPYIIAFLHCAHLPGQSLPKQPPTLLSADPFYAPGKLSSIAASGIGYSKEMEQTLHQTALSALPTALKGHDVQAQAGEWTLFLRPVVASKTYCLSFTSARSAGTPWA